MGLEELPELFDFLPHCFVPGSLLLSGFVGELGFGVGAKKFRPGSAPAPRERGGPDGPSLAFYHAFLKEANSKAGHLRDCRNCGDLLSYGLLMGFIAAGQICSNENVADNLTRSRTVVKAAADAGRVWSDCRELRLPGQRPRPQGGDRRGGR